MKLIDIKPNSERWLSLEDLPEEIWKYIPETCKYYMISNYSRIKSLKSKSTRGYKWCYYEEVTVECEY